MLSAGASVILSFVQRFVVLSSNHNENYYFFLPILARTWRRIGYEPLFLLYKNRELWQEKSRTAYVHDLLARNERILFVHPDTKFDIATIMQTCRLFGSAVSGMKDDDYLLTSDADMIPLSAQYFNQQSPEALVHIFGADAYGDILQGVIPPRFPLCYLGARSKVWKEILNIGSGNVDTELAKSFEGRVDQWDNDELFFAEKLKGHPFFAGELQRNGGDRLYSKGRCQLLARTWPLGMARGRIDRGRWGFDGSTEFIDCHALRPGYSDPETLGRILEVYFPQDAAALMDYVRTFVTL